MTGRRRFASISAALVVAAIAAVASYSHMRHLAIQYGQDRLIATLLPVSVDGMLVVATVALGDGRRYRWSAWLAFWVGVIASVIANVLAAEPSTIARCISAWPAIAFLLVVEVITRGGRIRAVTEATPVVTEVLPVTEPVEIPGAETPEPDSTEPEAKSARRTAGRPSAAKKVAKVAAKMPDAPTDKIARRAGVSERTVRRHRAATKPDVEPVNGNAVPELIEH